MVREMPEEGLAKLKVIQQSEDDETNQTYVIEGEDHTLGNALRWMIMKNPEVEFCGYTIPHPSEEKIHLRIQTLSGTALDSLETGLKDLSKLFEHVLDKFEGAVKELKNGVTEGKSSP
ncbi:unnamed protein product [Darwinula stevensoni]|uniref:DNA-directed RNA polymerases I and III subunit RPAC2 n=1 Tax=Darwinula stevensoni TaxID=69355 RepID=A0A7R8X3R8_9CRUS|nr:unnamed protein product [Darwinula stevensoni]CAG0885281.1 unnamed protein product [Darwinula stevensoni]